VVFSMVHKKQGVIVDDPTEKPHAAH
jgi:hypothetical protein